VVGDVEGFSAERGMMRRIAGWLLPLALLGVMAAMMLHSALKESQTFDEGMHLAAGYSYWTTGSYLLNMEHPPLSKLLEAAPLLPFPLKLPVDTEAWRIGDQAEIARQFLYHNGVPFETLVFRGRWAAIAMALALGFAIYWWTLSRGGVLAETIALALYAFDSNFIAHGHYATSDVPVSLFLFLAVAAWVRHLEKPSIGSLVVAGLALGLALATKFNALLLLPLHLTLALWVGSNRKRNMVHFLAAAVLALLVVAASYGPATIQAFLANPRKPLATFRDHHPYAIGVRALLQHNQQQQPAYLLGEVYQGGRWAYFPVAFLVKTPTAALLAMASLLLLWRRRAQWQWVFLFYASAYFAVTLAANINLGLRHLLPIYPLLYAAAGTAMAGLPRRTLLPLAGALGALHVYEAASVHPDHTAFFNTLAGGPDAGPRYLLDSNLDWGQDLGKLAQYMKERNAPHVAIAYFGSADPADFGITVWGLPGTWMTKDREELDSWAAISMTNLYDVYFDKPTYNWLRERKPDAQIGRSILVYDLRKIEPGRR
jgi:predicted membrane-bound dolichyl-phosphate-mannose-protein mannosyltransferase